MLRMSLYSNHLFNNVSCVLTYNELKYKYHLVCLLSVVFSNPPDDITQTTDPGQPTATVTWSPPMTLPLYTLSATHIPGHSFPIGTTMVMYTSTSQTGEDTDYSFTITVIGEFRLAIRVITNATAELVWKTFFPRC